MPDLKALPAVPGGKPKQAPPPVQLVPAPASAERAGPAANQAPRARGAAAGAPASAPTRDSSPETGHSGVPGTMRQASGLGAGSGAAAAGHGAGGGPASNGAGSHAAGAGLPKPPAESASSPKSGAAVPAPHAGSHERAGQQVRGLPPACKSQTSLRPCKGHDCEGLHMACLHLHCMCPFGGTPVARL